MFAKVKKGWQRSLELTRFFTVGSRHLIRVSIDQQQMVYDGGVKKEGGFWTIASESDKDDDRQSYTLEDSLALALARLPRDELSAAVAAAPADFAQVLAVAHGHIRIAVVSPGGVSESVLRDLGHGDKIVPPRFAGEVLSFLIYQPRGLFNGEPGGLWACSGPLAGTHLDKQLLLTVD